MKKYIITLALFMLYLVFIIGKQHLKEEAVVSEEVSSLQVVTSFYPIYLHTEAITRGTDTSVTNLTQQINGCLHDYQITVNQMQTLQRSDVLVGNGLGAESFIDKALSQYPELLIINASEQIEKGLQEDIYDHEKQPNDGAAYDHLSHAHENEHIWMSIEGGIMQVQQITDRLCEIDPKNEEAYQANSQAYIEAIQSVGEQYTALKLALDQPVVIVHNTLDYLMEELEVEVVATIAVDEQNTLTAREIQAVIQAMQEKDVRIILSEKQYSELGIVRRIAEETGSSIYLLNTMVTQGDVKAGEYEYVVRSIENIKTLEEAFRDE